MKKVLKNINLEKIRKNKKNIALMMIRIACVILFFVMYLQIYTQKLYILRKHTEFSRIVIATILFVVPSVLLFIKIKIPDIVNNILSMFITGMVIIENFVMLHYSQGYDISSFSKKAIAFNIFIVIVLALVLYAVSNSFKAAIIGTTVISTVFGLANYFVILFRGTGILAVDFFSIQTAANVAGGYTYRFTYPIYLFIMTSVAICFLAVKLGKNTLTKKWFRIIPIVLAIVMVTVGYKAFFVSKTYDYMLKVKYFKPQATFNKNGMYVTFVKSIKDLIVHKPEGYSIDKVRQLANENPGTEAALKNGREPNIIMIMDEAFTDFTSFSDIELNKDNVPFFHSLNKNAIKGQLWVSVFGGGTASTEFEALTSNSMAFVPNGITAYTTYINSPMSSMATVLKKQGYGGMISMHPYKPSGYKREKVYPLLGFDRFISLEDFTDKKMLGKHISDEGNFDRIIAEYEKYRKKEDKPFFLFDVTIQNHSPFNYKCKGLTKEINHQYNIKTPEATKYLNFIKHTDDALKKIVEYFEKVDEPTIILFFGDHQPRVEWSFYGKVKKNSRLGSEYDSLEKRNSQFVLWANYDIKEQKGVNLSANYLSSLVLDTAGLGKSGYQQFVSKVRKKVPVLTKYGYVGDNGKFYTLEDKKSPYYRILHKYNYIEYNNIFDVKNRVKELYEYNY